MWERAADAVGVPRFTLMGVLGGLAARPVGPAARDAARGDRDPLARRATGGAGVTLRVGIGVDAHALAEGVPLVLGGVTIDHPRGLAGHSDGDVLAHALIDALLGAAGLGDIGGLFPSGEATPRGISSLALLGDAYQQVQAAGVKLVNAHWVA